MPQPNQPRPNIFQRRGGIWTVIGMALVIGIAWAYWNQLQRANEAEKTAETHEAPRHLILISIDTLRADHVGAYGYKRDTTPHIDSLAREGVLFERHYASNPLTLPAHLTQLTGVTGLSHRVRDNLYHSLPEGLATLAETMSDEGFRTGAFVSAHTLKGGSGMERGFGVFDDEGVRTVTPGRLTIPERKADATLLRAGDWIARQGAERFFCFIHLFDPHAPYEPHSGITEHFGEGTVPNYDGEIAFTDVQIGKFLERLRTLDVFKDCLIVVTADHGEGLGDNNELTHGYYCYDTTTHVPLIFHGVPGVEAGVRVPHVVRNYDLAPTLAEIMKLKAERIREQAHGQGLLPQMRDPKKDPGLSVFMESHYAWLNANWAKIRGWRTSDSLTLFSGAETLHFKADQDAPVENADAVRVARDEVSRLMGSWMPPRDADLAPREAAAGSPYPGETPVAQNFDQESLNDTRDLPSPHAMKAVLRRYQEAEMAYDEQRFSTCAGLLRELLNEHPDFAMARRLLAAVLQGIVQQQSRELGPEQSRTLTAEAAEALRLSAENAEKLNQPEGALSLHLNRALLLTWLNDREALHKLAEHTGDGRIRWFALLADYRAGEAGISAQAREVFSQAAMTGAAEQAAKRHLAAIENGEPVPLAPWD